MPEEEIIDSLKESEARAPTRELCRKHGIAGQTFYLWKGKSKASRRKKSGARKKNSTEFLEILRNSSHFAG